MTQINTWLTFNGNCEAMTFCKACSYGALMFQTVGESPGPDELPGYLKRAVLRATLVNDQVILLHSDRVSAQGLITDNAVSLMPGAAVKMN
jgi:hypothetical protein